MIHRDFSRREFLARAAVAGAVAAAAPAHSAETTGKRFKIIAFTKPFQTLGPVETAELVADVGWDGVELPVRKGGQVAPERVEEDLPKFVEALRTHGRELTIATTDITAVTPASEKVLRTVSRLGIKRYRLGSVNYARDKEIPQQLNKIGSRLRDLAALSKELGLQAGFQNHSGANYVGAAIWDIWTMIKDLDAKAIGYCFDIGHATIEGGLAWPTHFRLAQGRLAAVFVKDFHWEKTPARGWRPVWSPLGDGAVDKGFFKTLKTTQFDGPVCQHHEYELGRREAMVAHFKRDLATLREWLAA